MWYKAIGLSFMKGLRWPGGFPPGIFYLQGGSMSKDLSIFVDESGDPGSESKYYLVTLVFHNQDYPLPKYERQYFDTLRNRGLRDIPFHMSPLMNGHDDYEHMDLMVRKFYLSAFRILAQHTPFEYTCFIYKKSELSREPSSPNSFVQRIRKDLAIFFIDQLEYLQQFEAVKIYYDNGQALVTKALHDAVGYALSKEAIVYRDASPARYRFSQVADYICTLELEALKYGEGVEGRTSTLFFGTKRQFERNYLKKIRKKRMG